LLFWSKHVDVLNHFEKINFQKDKK
jgi:hypothetical protein